MLIAQSDTYGFPFVCNVMKVLQTGFDIGQNMLES